MIVREMYPTLDAFYGEDELRVKSPEWDYGVHWRLGDRQWPRFRVSWLCMTGEVIAVEQTKDSRVLVLGIVPQVGDYPFGLPHNAWVEYRSEQEVERLLEGWAEESRDLSWARERLAGYEP